MLLRRIVACATVLMTVVFAGLAHAEGTLIREWDADWSTYDSPTGPYAVTVTDDLNHGLVYKCLTAGTCGWLIRTIYTCEEGKTYAVIANSPATWASMTLKCGTTDKVNGRDMSWMVGATDESIEHLAALIMKNPGKTMATLVKLGGERLGTIRFKISSQIKDIAAATEARNTGATRQ